MLRTLQHSHLRPFLYGYKVAINHAGLAITTSIGANDYSSSGTETLGTGLGRLYPSNQSARGSGYGIVAASSATDTADGAYATYSTLPDANRFRLKNNDAAGSGVDNKDVHSLYLTWESSNTDVAIPSASVFGSHKNMRLMGFRVASAGTIGVGGSQATVAVASSVYTLSFNNAFGRSPIVIAKAIATAQKAATISSATASSAAIKTWDSSEAAEDNSFYCLVLGFDSPNEQGGDTRRAIQVPQLKPRLLAFEITDTAGTPSLTVGSNDGTITDNGAGDYSITFTRAFAREPIVIPTGLDTRTQVHSAATTTECRVLSFNATGSATDGSVHVLVLGYDSATEL